MSEHRAPSDFLAPYRKAVIAFLTPGLVLLVPELVSGGIPDLAEWRTALIVSVLVAFGVYAVPNRTAPS